MRAVFGLFLLSLVAARKDEVDTVAFSGGGIRAAVGAMVADDLLAYLFKPYTEVHGLSGGSWGIALNENGGLAGRCPVPPPVALTKFGQFKKGLADALTPTDTIGPRAANMKQNTETWWKLWKKGIDLFVPSTKDNTGAYRELDDHFYHPNGGTAKNVYIHVAPVNQDGYEVNDCWFMNIAPVGPTNNFGCLMKPEQLFRQGFHPYPYDVNTHAFATHLPQVHLLDALTYSSAAFSTSEAFEASKLAYAPAPPFYIGVGTYIDLTDGGGYLNLPILKSILDFEQTPADTLIYAFDFGFYDKDYTLRNILTEFNQRMREVSGIQDYFDISFIAKNAIPAPTTQDHCYKTFTKMKNAQQLDVRFIGTCGLKKDQNDADIPDRTFIKGFPTTKISQIFTGLKGGAKVWTQTEMDKFVTGYSSFLRYIFKKEIATVKAAANGHVPTAKDPITSANTLNAVFTAWDPKCVWPQNFFLEQNATQILLEKDLDLEDQEDQEEVNVKNVENGGRQYFRGNSLEPME